MNTGTREQLARLASLGFSLAAAPEVWKEGNGYPLSNAVLAEYLEGDPPRWRDKAKALQECADLLLEHVDPALREYFRALCVLRSFDELRMTPLLAVWFGRPVEHWNYQCCRRIREDMMATRLVRWDGTRGFVMDEAVRAVLENALRESQPEKWRALHRAAYDLFTDWASRYPTARERWGRRLHTTSSFCNREPATALTIRRFLWKAETPWNRSLWAWMRWQPCGRRRSPGWPGALYPPMNLP